MANIDKVSVKNTVYNIVSPAVVSDYIEVIGGACTKPDGYVEDEVILAKQNDVQLLFKATQDIAFGANIVENTNCVRTTLEEVLKNAGGGGGASSADQVSYDNSDSGLEAENVQEAVDELATNAGTASSQIQTLTNNLADEVSARATLGAHNLLPKSILISSWKGMSFTNNSDGSFTVSGTSSENLSVTVSPTFTLKKGTYILHTGVIPSGTDIGINDKDGNRVADDYSGNVSFTLSQDTEVYVFFFAMSGIVISSTTIYPMIRLASDTDDTYQPYSMTNQEMTPYVQAISNPNLLDNPWFTVNQRGFSSFTSTAPDQFAYTVDRWNYYFQQSDGSISLSNGVITLDNTNGTGDMFLVQKADRSVLEALHNKVITASVLFSDGTIEKGSIVYTGTNAQLIVKTDYVVYMSSYDSGGNELFVISVHPSRSISIRAVKLELGSVSTLVQDTAPNYATELLKCQRYFINNIGNGASGYFNDANAILSVPVPVQMRAVPTVTLDYANNIIDATGNVIAVPANAAVTATQNQKNAVRITVPTSRTATGILPCVNADTSFNFSADL